MTLPNIVIDGRAVSDAELKFTSGGKAYAKFRVAASDSKKDDAGNWQTTEQLFVNVTVWDDAERIAEQVTRGASLVVAGRIHEREYEKSDGTKGRSLEVKFPMVSVKQQPGQSLQPAQQSGGWGQQSAPAADPWATPAQSEQAPY